MSLVTLRDLDPRATVYGSEISISTNYAVWKAKERPRKQRNSPRYDRSQNPPISSEHDLYFVFCIYSVYCQQDKFPVIGKVEKIKHKQ